MDDLDDLLVDMATGYVFYLTSRNDIGWAVCIMRSGEAVGGVMGYDTREGAIAEAQLWAKEHKDRTK